MNHYWGQGPTQYFYQLSPEKVLASIDSLGLSTTGRCLTLNSMENRVYEIQLEDREKGESFIVAKYYRPGRWSREQILDEHQFLQDLKAAEVPALCPLQIEGQTLFELADTGILYALFDKAGGRHFEAEVPDSLERLGSVLARLHQVGRKRQAPHRHQLNAQTFARDVVEFILETPLLNRTQAQNYHDVVLDIASFADQYLAPTPMQRLHGDCHQGNILFNQQIFLVDFDDMLTGPIIQDMWMVISGDEEEFRMKRDRLADGYEVIGEYPYQQEKLIEILRALRMIHYNGWVAKRYQDPSFIDAFPTFESEAFWQVHINDLYTQRGLIEKAYSQNFNF